MYVGLHVKYALLLSDFNENPSSGCQIVLRRWMDGHDEAISCFLQFSEPA